jgi:tRNA uridine 5-carboxymethylaminomethyl modification enzyme
MVDDLVTKGVDEPYRMFTSRAEYRLVLREDNADMRLGEIGNKIGLLKEGDYARFASRKKAVTQELERLESIKVVPNSHINDILAGLGASPIKKPHSLKEILRRPEVSYQDLEFFETRGNHRLMSEDVISQIEMEIKYEGYIKRQTEQIHKFKKLEDVTIPDTFSYDSIPGLSKEIVQKLTNVRPNSLGQATRISGVTPAAISVLMVYLKRDQNQAVSHSISS